MQFNSVKRSNNVAAGQAAGNTVANVYDTSRRTAPDFTNIAKTSIETRSNERIAATRAETQVARQGIASKALVKGTKQKAESAKKVNKTLGGAKRFAGIVGGLGTIATAGIMGNQAAKEAAEDKASRDAQYLETQTLFDGLKSDIDELITTVRENGPGEFNPAPYAPNPLVRDSEGNIVPQSQLNGSNNSSDGPDTGVGESVEKAGDTTSRYMSTLTNAGLNPQASAALTGHLQYESDDFQALEEYSPNNSGTRGYGHLQWTDIPGGSQRRTDFENWSSKNGLDTSSFEANSGFLLHEMQTNFNGSWTNGGSWEGLNSITNVDQASEYLQNNYIRPARATANSPTRRSNARSILSSWRAQ